MLCEVGVEKRTYGCHLSSVNRLPVFRKEHGERHVATICFAGVFLVLAEDGENAIVILAGANRQQSVDRIEHALNEAQPGDLLLLQNETDKQVEASRIAKQKGLSVVYSAAPFDAQAVRDVLSNIDTLLLNEVEADQLEKSLNQRLISLPVEQIVVTLGAKGARWIDTKSGAQWDVAGERVKAVDTTGAGDTFAGYFAVGFHEGMRPEDALKFAGRAAALKVTRHGAADAIPTRAEVASFLP